MKTPLRLLFALATTILSTTSCSTTPPKSVMNIQAGEKFILNQPIKIKPNSTRTFIQFGKVTSRSAFSRFDQHCELEVKDLKDTTQTIVPDTFIINDVRIDVMQIAKNNTVMVAQTDTLQSDAQLSSWHALASGSSDTRPEPTMDTVILYLKPTSKNPNIFRLTCAGSLSDGSLQDAPRSYRPQRAEINTILGPIGQIR